MLTVPQKLHLQAAFQAAHDCELQTDCPVALSLAQWALESGWGAKQPGNNCFGIKEYRGCYGIQMVDTWEVIHGQRVRQRLAFATFETLAQCFVKHAEIITEGRPYQAAWGEYMDHGKALEPLVRGIAEVYATDPQYGDKLMRIIQMPEVQQALNGVPA